MVIIRAIHIMGLYLLNFFSDSFCKHFWPHNVSSAMCQVNLALLHFLCDLESPYFDRFVCFELACFLFVFIIIAC